MFRIFLKEEKPNHEDFGQDCEIHNCYETAKFKWETSDLSGKVYTLYICASCREELKQKTSKKVIKLNTSSNPICNATEDVYGLLGKWFVNPKRKIQANRNWNGTSPSKAKEMLIAKYNKEEVEKILENLWE